MAQQARAASPRRSNSPMHATRDTSLVILRRGAGGRVIAALDCFANQRLEHPMSEVSDRIESLIEADDWKSARSLIRAALRTEPVNHWLLSRLALTHYEEFKYEKALEYETRALALAPNCPLALWGYAGALAMLGREREALEVYRRLVRRGAASIAYGECGEGLARARGLVADCLYRMAGCYKSLGQSRKAVELLEKHLAQRGRGCHSIYALREVRKELNELRPKAPSASGAI